GGAGAAGRTSRRTASVDVVVRVGDLIELLEQRRESALVRIEETPFVLYRRRSLFRPGVVAHGCRRWRPRPRHRLVAPALDVLAQRRDGLRPLPLVGLRGGGGPGRARGGAWATRRADSAAARVPPPAPPGSRRTRRGAMARRHRRPRAPARPRHAECPSRSSCRRALARPPPRPRGRPRPTGRS